MHRVGPAQGLTGVMPGPALEGVRHCVLAGEQLEYQLWRSGRRTLGLTVKPEGRLVVTAPSGASLERIESILRRRRSWIRRQIGQAIDRPPPIVPKQWVSGETHRYLGRQYRLRIRTGAQAVSLAGSFFDVSVPERTPTRVRSVMDRWYLDHAPVLFQRRAQSLIDTTARLRLRETPPIQVRRLALRWGSCSPNGSLLVNVEAVKLPIGCIDYLLMHELCHTVVPHHGKKFWRFLDACMPDWERWRGRLVRAEG